MTVKERTSVRLNQIVRQKLNEKCPEVNLSQLLNRVLEYILEQDDTIINEFTALKTSTG